MKTSIIIIIVAILLAIIVIGLIINSIITKLHRGIGNAKSLISEIQRATEESANTPMTISGAEGLYSQRILRDFPEFNFDIAKQTVTSVLTKYFNVLNTDKEDESLENCCTKSFIGELNGRKQMENVLYNKFRIHKTAISDYKKTNSEAVITYQSAVEYELPGKMMSQHIYKTNYVYFLEYGANGENVSLRCKYCGAPLDKVGLKVCPYCDSEIEASVERTWKVNKIEKQI